ncbi:PREDICTED: solute carrier family 25 member 46-like [Habropoda laboriosa]|uniref:solute carrier family 25 member 46-like n=1 Tax=Habropoda laboriosa TaxID=597456 RepID=UPI00083D245C|nr:PREDICTED: solute carrier family 25 member 46-like [Habropoda laboriosa]XP_017795800.1 PREDICTED: solute carrier family 25 member 46-like [Habropoda laboriosa]
MAGLENYGRVYQEKNGDTYFYRHEVIRPLHVSSVISDVDDDSLPYEGDATAKTFMIAGCGVATLIMETLLVHPLDVLRRQCQVNPGLKKYHIIPMTLVPVVVGLHQTQGINTLWKGIGSVVLVRGMLLAIENFISKVTLWPKEVRCNSSLKLFGQHILLKCISIGLITPFYSASLVETVQSEIASESPGILDVFRNGAIRLVEVNNKGRLIPIYSLLPPTVFYVVSKYLFTLAAQGITSRIMYIKQKHSQQLRGAYSRDLTIASDIELRSALISASIAEALFYPWETVIHRLHLQGTRTIIDNLDTGRSVTPLLTGYSGVTDCCSTIISTEGPLGLYKGFGALLLEFTVNFVIARVIKRIMEELRTVFEPKPKLSERPPWYNAM